MPPRYSYWTILAGGLPTAFRAAERADLLPTFNRIREKHPDAELKWFARGRLWGSPEESLADLQRARVRRERDWRPGGDHRDPRQAFKGKRQRDTRPREHARRDQAPHDETRRAPSFREHSPREQRPRDPAQRGQTSRENTRREQPPREHARRPQKPWRPASKPDAASTKPGPANKPGARPPKRRPR